MNMDKIKPAVATLVAVGVVHVVAARLMRAPKDDQAQSETPPSLVQMNSVGTQTATPMNPVADSTKSQKKSSGTTATTSDMTAQELLQAIKQLRGHDIPKDMYPEFMHALRALRNDKSPFTRMVKQLFIEGLWVDEKDSVDLDEYITKSSHQNELAKVEQQRNLIAGQLSVVEQARDKADDCVKELLAEHLRATELEITLDAATNDLKAATAAKVIAEESRGKLQDENKMLQKTLATTNEALAKAVKQTEAHINDHHEKKVSDLESTHVSKEEYEKLQAELLILKENCGSRLFHMAETHQKELWRFRAEYNKLKKEYEAGTSRISLQTPQTTHDSVENPDNVDAEVESDHEADLWGSDHAEIELQVQAQLALEGSIPNESIAHPTEQQLPKAEEQPQCHERAMDATKRLAIEPLDKERASFGVEMDTKKQQIGDANQQIMATKSDTDSTESGHEEAENVFDVPLSVLGSTSERDVFNDEGHFQEGHLINPNNNRSFDRETQDLKVAVQEAPHNDGPLPQAENAGEFAGNGFGTPEPQQVSALDAEMLNEQSAQRFSFYERGSTPSSPHSQRESVPVQNKKKPSVSQEYDPSELGPDLTAAQIDRFQKAATARSQPATPLSTPIYACHRRCGEYFFGEDYPEKVWEHALKCQHCKNEGKPVACMGCDKIFLDNKTFRTQHGRLCNKGQLPAGLAAEHKRKEQEMRAGGNDNTEQEKLPAHEKPCWNEIDGRSCTNPKCAFKHTVPRTRDNSQPHDVPCKFEREFGSCTKAKCPFKHTQPIHLKHEIQCRFEQKFGACAKKTCAYKHTTPRSPAMTDRSNRY